ncbi:MAG: AraC family transcriptional regulator [Pseudomonadota bacterium]
MRDYYAIRFMDRGNYISIADDSIRRLQTGYMNFDDNFDGVSTEGYSFYSLEAPREVIDKMLFTNGVLTVPRADSPPGRILLEMMSAVFRGLRDGGASSGELLIGQTSAFFELLAHGIDTAGEAARPEYLHARAAAMQRYIDANLDDPDLGPARLAATFGLSRAGVFRAFEPFGGVANTIARRRMARAYRTLATAEPRRGTVRVVAEACGYSDPAHFCRVFRRHLDLSPGDVLALQQYPDGDRASLDPVPVPDTFRLSKAYR